MNKLKRDFFPIFNLIALGVIFYACTMGIAYIVASFMRGIL